MLKCAGLFLFVDMAKRYFTKTYSSPADLVQLLKSRGLKISDERKAERYIESIGYYRLSAYMYPFLEMPKNLHQYKTGASFKKIMMLYRFDKKLRMLLLNEIEKIEIAVREAVMNVTAEMSGDDFWLMNSIHFANPHTFADTTNLIEREYRKSTEDFIQHFKKIRKAISRKFGLQPRVFESWLTTLTLVRNSCCHHSRVWNKVNFILPMIPKRISHPWITLPVDPQRTYFNICVIKYFIGVISPNNDMLTKLRWLFVDFPEIDLAAMGFPKGWEMEPIWK